MEDMGGMALHRNGYNKDAILCEYREETGGVDGRGRRPHVLKSF